MPPNKLRKTALVKAACLAAFMVAAILAGRSPSFKELLTVERLAAFCRPRVG